MRNTISFEGEFISRWLERDRDAHREARSLVGLAALLRMTHVKFDGEEPVTASGRSAAAGLYIRANESDDVVHGSAGAEDRGNPSFL